MTRESVPCAACAVVALTILALPAPVDAQAVPDRNFRAGMTTGFGYAGVAPDVLAGGGVWHFRGTSGIGFFADAKMTTSRPSGRSNYCPPALDECTVEWVSFNRPQDQFARDEKEWLIFNLGGMYALAPEFAIMLGAGPVRLRRTREYVDDAASPDDPREPITPTGSYFVDHHPEPEWKAQAVIGFLMRAGTNLAFRFGYETGPGGMSVGAYLVLP